MGMFDDVRLPEPIPCPHCTAPLEYFQSKDRDCVLATLGPQDVDNFYTACPECRTWVEFNRKKPIPRPETDWREDFELCELRPSPRPARSSTVQGN